MEHLEANNNKLELIYKLKKLHERLERLQTEIDVALAEVRSVHSQIAPRTDAHKIDIINKQLSIYFDIDINVLKTRNRKIDYIVPRHIYFALCKTYTKFSDEQIAALLERDRTTAMNSYKVIQNAKDTGDVIYNHYLSVEDNVNAYLIVSNP